MARPGHQTDADGRALFVDYGGVLTPAVATAWSQFEEDHDIPGRSIAKLLWSAYERDAEDSLIARLERGELSVEEFEEQLGAQLRAGGYEVEARGLVGRLFGQLSPSGGVWDLVAEVRAAGIPAVLVSNSWGFSAYPEDQLDEAFDEVVISGRVGMRKPGRAIFEHAASLVGARLDRCVLIDDGHANVEAADRYGVTGVLHDGDDRATRVAVQDALGIEGRPGRDRGSGGD